MPMMSGLSERASAAFEAVGAPPADPDDLLVWGRQLLATTVWLMTLDEIDPQRARSIQQMVFALGATHNRAKLEGKVQKLRATVSEYQQAGSAITEVAGSSVRRPATARGGKRPGPKVVPEDPSDEA